MNESQTIELDAVNLIPKVLQIKNDDYRLIQICATRIENGVELLYSFGKQYDVLGLRIRLQQEEEIMSISKIYAPAFLYENEIHDLFGVPVKMISVDYNGNFYRTEKRTPFKD